MNCELQQLTVKSSSETGTPINDFAAGLLGAVLDLLHVGNPQRAVWVDESHYLTLDENGNPGSPNPNYKQPIAYQPPMAVRNGLEVSF